MPRSSGEASAPKSEARSKPMPTSSSSAWRRGISRPSKRSVKSLRKRSSPSFCRSTARRSSTSTPRWISSSTSPPSTGWSPGLIMSSWKRRDISTGVGSARRVSAISS
jgi:hypothetical protein